MTLWKRWKQSRRDLFRSGPALAAAWQAVSGQGGAKAEAAAMETGPKMYESIGVKPLINARGTFTIITGSQTLPEVKKAMEEASRHFVNMDELMDGVGKRLAELSGAEWGIITNGCAAAIAHCTAAAVAGCNPERMQQLPDLSGFAKNEVIIPAYSRNVYDHAVRMVGVKVVEVKDPAQLEAAFTARTAMVYILGGPGDDGPLGTRVIAPVAKKYGVPVLVDAAAEILTLKPNVHLERGATAVAYSGGKCIRGPQAAGLVLGDKKWLQAAWLNSAPHHAFGRALKAGKEEIMGMLAAVEMWQKRDHKAEWKAWERQLGFIAERAGAVPGVKAEITQPDSDLSNRSPKLTLRWDPEKIGITGSELSRHLFSTEPRITVAGANAASLWIIPYQMMPGDEKVVGERLEALLRKPPQIAKPKAGEGPNAALGGEWRFELQYPLGAASHTVTFVQDGVNLGGRHRGEFYSGTVSGKVDGASARFRASHRMHGTSVDYQFQATVAADGGSMSGTVSLGEYGVVPFTAAKKG